MRKAILVHGALHGSWCWQFVLPELQRVRIDAQAIDLPITDPELGATDYAAVTLEAIAALDAGDIVVGHSMAGLMLPLVAEARPDLCYVYVGAFLPSIGMSAQDQFARDPLLQVSAADPRAAAEGPYAVDELGRLSVVNRDAASWMFYNDCSPEMQAWALAQLRPQSQRISTEVTPLTAWPPARSEYILCLDDQAINPEWARSVVPARLNVHPVEIDGGHSPFLSRPTVLADAIGALAQVDA